MSLNYDHEHDDYHKSVNVYGEHEHRVDDAAYNYDHHHTPNDDDDGDNGSER